MTNDQRHFFWAGWFACGAVTCAALSLVDMPVPWMFPVGGIAMIVVSTVREWHEMRKETDDA